ncbi:hypothetical protein ACFVFH_06670 [Streptomyces sp. NPDC057697]|uniref:hypothetical protein n=1 Tax=Streptomyces sp. NPDC057697 TaxID=3346219 RepID=UPI0036C9F484
MREPDSRPRAPGSRASGPRVPDAWVDCDVGGVVHVDLALVEAVARLGLVARRAGGRRLRLRRVPPELKGLLDLVGLAEVVDVGYGAGAEEAEAEEAGEGGS